MGWEIVNSNISHWVLINTKFQCTFQVLFAFFQIVNINCFDILSKNVQITIWWCNVTDLGLLVADITDISDYFMSYEINHHNFMLFTLQNNQVKVIPIIWSTINDKGSSKWTYTTVVLIFFCHSTSHMWLLPSMNTLSDMSFVWCIFKVVN